MISKGHIRGGGGESCSSVKFKLILQKDQYQNIPISNIFFKFLDSFHLNLSHSVCKFRIFFKNKFLIVFPTTMVQNFQISAKNLKLLNENYFPIFLIFGTIVRIPKILKHLIKRFTTFLVGL